MRFIHYSTGNTIIDSTNFIVPDISIIHGDDRHSYHPAPKTLFLSIEGEDGNTEWYNECVKRGEGYEHYLSSTKNVFDINMERILVIDNSDDLKNFIANYCILKICTTNKYIKYESALSIARKSYRGYLSNIYSSNPTFENVIQKIMEDIIYINHYLEDRNNGTDEHIVELMKRRETLPLPKISNGKFDLNPRKRCEFFDIDVYRLLKTLYDHLGLFSEVQRHVYTYELDYIDYEKIYRNGFNGLYYTKNLIDTRNSINIDCKMIRNIYRTNKTLFYCNILQRDFIDYFDWFNCDVMMLWNIDF